MSSVLVPIKELEHYKELPLPSYATIDSAGMDLVAAISENESVELLPRQRKLIPTGIAIALPKGFEAQIRPRSGLAIKSGITVTNAPGTIDADYRGEIFVSLINLSEEAFRITRGMRIAQMVIARYERINWNLTESLDETARGAGGFGSTGL
ncbi:MAG: dUTP diphosphatase [Candidatus Midichloria mitochondrii]|uniref:Deoxyuridine 5'-triphosphate nucleotidohydrolase n=1 Tax=Midichloria mitochondrii (strain IricVA) TaxID=696127 RepID=F7XU53_MIDMI|nr:dUTP diphosphatase [Candidatus Midichloria mitochondrii]AEI89412.1 putative deoxyuridine 5'triphosphate nucleotidohydrolase [Candidatus Midichloria mitochondrii IricVA]MDJ1256958.1 dUTP diphosphatase [Candidatus Midichloria mitochondrii]MDJ1288712.1 dUTP diphosphatase [Candidatus Midichloria mitochondrii]MDJ1299538.1 dUTP diphosphatase [Candidatus Midichloria mitochondrii]MDJ1313624.1 dUTP diphosphatase [Candidatus Midichloria mitochondrii]